MPTLHDAWQAAHSAAASPARAVLADYLAWYREVNAHAPAGEDHPSHYVVLALEAVEREMIRRGL